MKPFQVDGGQVGSLGTSPFIVGDFIGRGGRSPSRAPPHTPRQFTTWPFVSPFPPKYKHILYPPWWSQGCRDIKSSSPSWSLAPLIQMDGISYPIPVIHFSSSFPFFLCWPPAWPVSLLLSGTTPEACLLRWPNSTFRSWYSQLKFSWSPAAFLFIFIYLENI